MTDINREKNRLAITDFWKITIALLLVACGYTTSLLVLMNYIGENM
jgi:hypothetical protein